MTALLETFFGANWRTNLSGYLTLLLAAVAVKPELVDFLPEPWRGYVTGAATLFAFVSGTAFVANTKDAKVSGNGTDANPYQVPKSRSSGASRYVGMLVGGIFLGLGFLFLTGCASDRTRPPLRVEIPLGAESRYGSLLLAGGYLPPPDYAWLPDAPRAIAVGKAYLRPLLP